MYSSAWQKSRATSHGITPMSSSTKTKVIAIRWIQFALRIFELLGALGTLAIFIMISGIPAVIGWVLRIPVCLLVPVARTVGTVNADLGSLPLPSYIQVMPHIILAVLSLHAHLHPRHHTWGSPQASMLRYYAFMLSQLTCRWLNSTTSRQALHYLTSGRQSYHKAHLLCQF